MSRTFRVGTSWKMNKTIAETEAYLRELVAVALPPEVEVFVVPPFTALDAARRMIAGAPIRLGAQNMHWAEAGAHTGEISAPMLVECGVEIVELGHSERRADQGETDETVNAKVRAALAHGLRPLVCVGDRAEELAAGASTETVLRQVKMAFAGCDPATLAGAMVAYEPVWAIGEAGRVAEPEHVAAVHAGLRAGLASVGLADLPLLYGGSVDADNAAGLAAITDVDGVFVGRAAWTAAGLREVMTAAVAGWRGRIAA